MFTSQFLKDLAERVIATAAQALLGCLTVASMAWGQKMQVVGVAALASILKGLVATQVGAPNTAALLTVEADTEKGAINIGVIPICVVVTILTVAVMKVFGLI